MSELKKKHFTGWDNELKPISIDLFWKLVIVRKNTGTVDLYTLGLETSYL